MRQRPLMIKYDRRALGNSPESFRGDIITFIEFNWNNLKLFHHEHHRLQCLINPVQSFLICDPSVQNHSYVAIFTCG